LPLRPQFGNCDLIFKIAKVTNDQFLNKSNL
jgi:hypothetical protein